MCKEYKLYAQVTNEKIPQELRSNVLSQVVLYPIQPAEEDVVALYWIQHELLLAQINATPKFASFLKLKY